MAESLDLPVNGGKKEIYEALLPQIASVIEVEPNAVANLANVAAMLKEAFGFFWVGFYMADDDDTLVLGPFQGPLACTRIKKGRGVCGTVYKDGESLVVPDVDEFPGHIACSSLSKSEIVIPLLSAGKVIGVLDVDSDELNSFDETDRLYLEQICEIVVKRIV